MGQVANSSGLGEKLGDAGLLGLGGKVDFLGDHFLGAGFMGVEEAFDAGMVGGQVVEGEVLGADEAEEDRRTEGTLLVGGLGRVAEIGLVGIAEVEGEELATAVWDGLGLGRGGILRDRATGGRKDRTAGGRKDRGVGDGRERTFGGGQDRAAGSCWDVGGLLFGNFCPEKIK